MDVDGVLNHAQCPEWQNGDWRVLDLACVERVKQICADTGAVIVLSSTWRTSAEGKALLKEHFGDLIIDQTEAKLSYRPRYMEIREWLYDNGPLDGACVVDDDADAETPGIPFVRTSFEDGGLNEQAAKRVREALCSGTLGSSRTFRT